MKPFSELMLSGILPISLVWKQPKFVEDYYELVDDTAGDVLYATLGWPKWLSDQAIARSAVGNWYFDRHGWTRRTIKVTRPVEPAEISSTENHPVYIEVASFEAGLFWEGDLILKSGEAFHWYCTNTFRNAWVLTEIISVNDVSQSTEMDMRGESARVERKREGYFFKKRSKPIRRERLVYEIKFGMRWFKQEAWISLPTNQGKNHPELIFLLCCGMYLGYCYNQDSAAVVAVSTTAAVS